MCFFKNIFNNNKSKNKQKGKINTNIQNSEINIDLSYRHVLNSARKGKVEDILNELDILKRSVENQHPCAPYWKYNISLNENEGIKIGHMPTSKEALEKYPPKGNVRFKLPDEYKWAKNMNDLINYGYKKQIPITLDIEELKLWIGDYLIENMKSDENTKCTLEIVNREFPPPIPVKIEFGENIFSIDYLEIGVTEINGSKITLSNEKDKYSKIVIKFIIDLEQKEQCRFFIDITKGYELNVEANLLIGEFLEKCNLNLDMKIIYLKEGKTIISFNNPNIKENKVDLEKRNKLLRDLRKLEKYYDVEFILPKDNILEEDLENITILLCAMENKSYDINYDSITLTLEVNKDSNQHDMIKNIEKSMLKVDLNDKCITLFNQSINFKEAYREFYNIKVKDKERILEKLELLDNKDIIKLELIADGDGICKIIYK